MKTVYLIITLIAFSVTVNAQDARYSFKESYTLSSPGQVSISSSDGDIEAIAFAGTKTDVFYIVKKNNRILNISKADLEKELELQIEQTGNSLSIVVKYKNDFTILDWKDKMVVSFRLQLPAQTACNLRTSDGNISMTGLKGEQRASTSDGNVDVSDVQGSLIASTSDGNVTIKNIAGPVEAKTSDGDIRLSDVRGDVKGSTSDGNISADRIKGGTFIKTSDGNITFRDLSGSLTASTSDGNVSGNLIKLVTELSVRTSDGDIKVEIPSSLGLDLDIKGESLHVPLSNFSGRSDDKRIQGKTNGGGIPVNIHTSGTVTLAYN